MLIGTDSAWNYKKYGQCIKPAYGQSKHGIRIRNELIMNTFLYKIVHGVTVTV